MKRMLIVVIMFALVGGGIATLWFFHVPPFGRPSKKEKVSAHKPAPATVSPSNLATAPDASTDKTNVTNTTSTTHTSNPASLASTKPSAKMSDADLTRLSAVYEQMPVDEATKIMAKLPDVVVEPLLRRMDERQVGKLLSAFTADRAAKLTLAMTRTVEPAKIQ